MPSSLRIGNIAGIDTNIHASRIIILVLLTVALAIGWLLLYLRKIIASD